MSRQYWSETLAWATAAGTAVANNTETILIPNVTIPANYLQDGRAIRITASGAYGTHSATMDQYIAIRWGGVAGTVISKTALNMLTASMGGGASMTANWWLEAIIQTRSNGSSGTLFTNGIVNYYSAALATGGTIANYGLSVPLVSGASGGTTPVVSAAVDLTADTALSLCVKWNTTNAANSIRCDMYHLEGMN